MSSEGVSIRVDDAGITEGKPCFWVTIQRFHSMGQEALPHSVILMKQENGIATRQIEAAVPVLDHTQVVRVALNLQS